MQSKDLYYYQHLHCQPSLEKVTEDTKITNLQSYKNKTKKVLKFLQNYAYDCYGQVHRCIPELSMYHTPCKIPTEEAQGKESNHSLFFALSCPKSFLLYSSQNFF